MKVEDFDRAAERTRLGPRAMEAARLILVERFSGAEAGRRVAARSGKPFAAQTARDASKRIVKKLKELDT